MNKKSGMDLSNKTFWIFGITLVVGLFLQACAGSGMLENSESKEYPQEFNRMKEVVKQAVRAGNMNINYVNESDDGNQLTLVIGRERFMNNEQVQQERGEIRIIKLGDNKTGIEVDNPEYHFSVPSHQKEDYQRIIFARIDNILEK